MASRGLGTLTLDLIAKIGGFESGMDKAARITDKRMGEIEKRARAAGKLIGGTLAAGATAAAYAIQSTIDSMDELSKAALKVGLRTEDFSKLTYAASLADVSMESLVGSLGKLTKAQSAALKETSEQARVFDALGISIKEADGSLRDSSDVLIDFADKFKALEGSPEAMAAGFSLFGRSFQDLIPLLKDGGDGLRSAGAELESFGGVLSTQAGQAAEEFNDNLTRLKTSVGGLALAVTSDLLPDLVEITGGFVSSANGGGELRESVDGITSAVRELIDVGRGLGQMFDLLGNLRQGLAGLEKQGAGLTGGLIKLAAGDLDGAKEALAYYQKGTEELERAAGMRSNKNAAGVANAGYANLPRYLGGQQFDASFSAIGPNVGKPDTSALRLALAGGTPKATGGTRSSSKQREMPDFAKEAAEETRRAVAAVSEAREQFDAWAAQLAGPVSDAAYQFSVDQERLNELARTGEIDATALAAAHTQLRTAYDENVAAINAQLTPAQEVNAAIKEQILLLGMSAEQQEIYNNLKHAGVDANSAFGQSVIESTEALQAAREQADLMAGIKDGLSDMFVDFVSGAKSAKEAFGDFADQLFAEALKFVANKAIQAMFSAFSQQGAGAYTGDGTGAGSLAGFGSMIASFGGGRASGGSVDAGTMYQVNERGAEMLSISGKDYLMMGANAGRITPNHKLGRGGGGFTQVINQNYAAPNDPRTRDQAAAKVAFETQRVLSRNR